MSWNRTQKELIAKLKDFLNNNNEKAIILTLQKIGQEAVNWARENGSYTDRTGNLRNSIGYAIFKDRKLYISGADSSKARENEKVIVNLVENRIPEKGYGLIVYAGMEYGIYVEAKGYVVLSGSIENSTTAKMLDAAIRKAVE